MSTGSAQRVARGNSQPIKDVKAVSALTEAGEIETERPSQRLLHPRPERTREAQICEQGAGVHVGLNSTGFVRVTTSGPVPDTESLKACGAVPRTALVPARCRRSQPVAGGRFHLDGRNEATGWAPFDAQLEHGVFLRLISIFREITAQPDDADAVSPRAHMGAGSTPRTTHLRQEGNCVSIIRPHRDSLEFRRNLRTGDTSDDPRIRLSRPVAQN